MLTMYGIKNCDTIKKARRWLEAHQIEYRFHDYRASGHPYQGHILQLASVLGVDKLGCPEMG